MKNLQDEDRGRKNQAVAKIEKTLRLARLESAALTNIYRDLLEIAEPPLPDEYREVEYSKKAAKEYLRYVRAGLPPNVIFSEVPGMPHPAVVREWKARFKTFRVSWEAAWRESTEVLRQKKLELPFEQPDMVEVRPGVYAEDPASIKRRELGNKNLETEIKWRDPHRYSRRAIETAMPRKLVLEVKPPGADDVAPDDSD